MGTAVELASLERAAQRLAEGIVRYQRESQDDQLRDGLIQRFEFTYELSHKVLRRILTARAASPDDIAGLSFADLIRTASVEGLIVGDWPAWRLYRDLRSRSAHIQDDEQALSVVAHIPDFLTEVQAMIARLQDRQ